MADTTEHSWHMLHNGADSDKRESHDALAVFRLHKAELRSTVPVAASDDVRLGNSIASTAAPPSEKDIADATEAAKKIHTARDSVTHWIGGRTADYKAIFRQIEKQPPSQMGLLQEKYAELYGHADSATGRGTGMLDDLKASLKPDEFDRVTRLISEKQINDVPAEKRVDGSSLITDSGEFHVGANHLKTADGREFDLYIPQNARQEVGPDGKVGMPLVVAMHGVEPDKDNPDMMERESGLNVEAERKGVAVAYLRPVYRPESALLGAVQKDIGAWNMQGTTGFLPSDPSYDDAKFLKDALAKVNSGLKVDHSRVGVVGMSDGGRFAQDFAAANPGVFSSVVSFEGTHMSGDPVVPKAGENVMIVHGLNDHTLPWDQQGRWSRGILSVLSSPIISNTELSRPAEQVEMWLKADGAKGPNTEQWLQVNDSDQSGPKPQSDDGITRTYDYKGTRGEVRVDLVRGAEHAIDDYKNVGGMILGEVTYLDFSSKGVQFILDHPTKPQ